VQHRGHQRHSLLRTIRVLYRVKGGKSNLYRKKKKKKKKKKKRRKGKYFEGAFSIGKKYFIFLRTNSV
jgi:hypothetical protein